VTGLPEPCTAIKRGVHLAALLAKVWRRALPGMRPNFTAYRRQSTARYTGNTALKYSIKTRT
jgi:hypothetical protein